ncbi:acyl CoA binding protein-domain-containing protein [Halteromyces radiatus]|uniref:acyl CoA binding protein-domain-containing protein n=1 Tax=Halteromyces radiatus TaxID=101107 RepID=UPI002220FC81|nr:acyl CoA binding protein-domain-containing protein [Halteromyces radiatus]KAI8082812.1 acyl CoA binding protein-domain-containing protein [Halteromyces radiatus]
MQHQRLPSSSSSSSSSFTIKTQLQFSRAITIVRSLPASNIPWQPSVHDKLCLYGLYKQASEGDCYRPRPSSRLLVQHAKWKAWDQLRQWSTVEAQKQYVMLLIDILLDFIERYPHHQMTPTLQNAIHYIKLDTDMIPSVEDKNSEGFFHHIKEDELTEQQEYGSPVEPHFNNDQPNYNPPYSSTSTATSNYTYPMTPDHSSPSQQQQQNILQQQKQQWYERNRHYVQQKQQSIINSDIQSQHHRHHPIDNGYDGFSDVDTIDREVAAATSGLGLLSPEQHPYHMMMTNEQSGKRQSIRQSDNNQILKEQKQHGTKIDSKKKTKSNTSSSVSPSEKALESLQTEVAALTEQLDYLRIELAEKKNQKLRWSWFRLGKTLLKHTSINLVILLLAFIVLYKRKSPIAYVIIGYVGPRIQDILHYLVERLFFWKLTV